ncbi:MAG: transglycosylase SLT domain-containing protein [Deltaproteobacteria bacterium]|nr:transglycosylase SLT domain-containing protein [Deltaproteobacteria bacterium]
MQLDIPKNYLIVFLTIFCFYHTTPAETASLPNITEPLTLKSDEEQIKTLLPFFRWKSYRNNEDLALFFSVIKAESDFEVSARSKAGALGLMQLMPRTAIDEFQRSGLKISKRSIRKQLILQPELNIALGAGFLKRLNSRFGKVKNPRKRLDLVLAAYNAGPERLKKAFGCDSDHCLSEKVNRTKNAYFSRRIKSLPRETRKYIKNIKKTIPYYTQLLDEMEKTPSFFSFLGFKPVHVG